MLLDVNIWQKNRSVGCTSTCSEDLRLWPPKQKLEVTESGFKKAEGIEEGRRWSGGRMGGWGGADGQQWKSTADSCNPRSLPQLDMIVMESLGQKP